MLRVINLSPIYPLNSLNPTSSLPVRWPKHQWTSWFIILLTQRVYLFLSRKNFVLPEETVVFLKGKPHSSLHEHSDTSISNTESSWRYWDVGLFQYFPHPSPLTLLMETTRPFYINLQPLIVQSITYISSHDCHYMSYFSSSTPILATIQIISCHTS